MTIKEMIAEMKRLGWTYAGIFGGDVVFDRIDSREVNFFDGWGAVEYYIGNMLAART